MAPSPSKLRKAIELSDLRDALGVAEKRFDDVCRKHYVNRWDYYLACERNPASCPVECHEAADAYIAATHAFYAARDGERGFLGGRGL